MRLYLPTLCCLLSFTVSAQFGWVRDVAKKGANAVKGVARNAGNVYQQATAPVRNVATTVYDNTLRQPVNQIRTGIKSALPNEVVDFYKYEVQNRVAPFVQNTTGIVTGEVNVVDGTKAIVDHSIALVKEMALTPELLALYSTARAAASPIPQEFFSALKPHWPKVTSRPLHSDVAKYIVSESLVRALTAMGGSSMEAITLYDVVVFREPLDMSILSLSLLAHEMIHVAQYRQLSFSGFLSTYMLENIKHGYDRSPKEVEGRNVQVAMRGLLAATPNLINSAIRLDNIAPGNFKNTTAATLAFFSEASPNPNDYSGYLLAKIQATNNVNDAKALMGYIIGNNQISDLTKSYGCRLMCAGPVSNFITPQDKMAWAKSAVAYGPTEAVNWYFLAAAAYQLQDAVTEYNALISLAGIMISEELNQGQPNYSRLYGAGSHLGRAIQLANYIASNSNTFFDPRLPFIMLVELGVYLPLDFTKDLQLNQYAQTLANIDGRINVKDELHLRTIGALTGAHLYFCIQNANLFQAYGTLNYLNEKRNRATSCLNHARWGQNEVMQFYPGSPIASLYQSLFNNYIQSATSFNN